MVKVVENGERICTVTLDGSESSIVFQNDYRYFAVKNESDADVYVSLNRDIVEGADGVMTIGSKESALFAHMKPNVNMFFVKGKGKIQVFASSNAVNPFKSAPIFDGGVMASGNPVQIDGLQGGVPFSEITVRGNDIIGQNLTVNVSGKNLIPTDYMSHSGTYNGVTFNVNDNGKFDISGTATKGFALVSFIKNMSLVGGKKYTFSCNKQYDINTFNCAAKILTKDGIWKHSVTSYPSTIIASDGDYIGSFGIWANEGVEISAENVEIQLEIGDTATEYETPVGSKITITPTSNPYVIPNDIRQQEGLNNISVSEGEISVTGVRKNAAIKRIWDKLDELTTAIIVSNGETE